MTSSTVPPLSEADLKAIAITRLHRSGRISSGAIIANEYRLADSGVRADLAVLDKKFIGIEIKSDRDSLRRLATQIKAYKLYFDLTILLVAEKHAANIDIDLTGVELWTVSNRGRVKTVCRPMRARSNSAPERLVDLLPARQRRKIQDSTQSSMLGSIVAEAFRKYFHDRFSTTSRKFWDSSENSSIGKESLGNLSVYKPLRKKAADRAQERASIFKEWESTS